MAVPRGPVHPSIAAFYRAIVGVEPVHRTSDTRPVVRRLGSVFTLAFCEKARIDPFEFDLRILSELR